MMIRSAGAVAHKRPQQASNLLSISIIAPGLVRYMNTKAMNWDRLEVVLILAAHDERILKQSALEIFFHQPRLDWKSNLTSHPLLQSIR